MLVTIPAFDLVIELGDPDPQRPGTYLGGNLLSSDLKVDGDDGDFRFNLMMDAIESIVLAHACAGVDVCSPAYVEGIETAVDACCDHG